MNKKKIAILFSVCLAVILSIFAYRIFQKKSTPKKYGEVRIVKDSPGEKPSDKNQNEKVVTESDEMGNQYEKRCLINEGVMFDVPKGFEGKKEGDTYYIYPSKKDKKNFSLMFAMRFSPNSEWKKKRPEDAKIALMDGTKGSVKYINCELTEEYLMTHLNRGKANKMDESLIYEQAKTATFANPKDPTKTLDMDVSFSYIPLLNTNVEVTGMCPKPMAEQMDDVYKSIVASVTEYNPLNYRNPKILNQEVKAKGFETKFSTKYVTPESHGSYVTATVSDNIFDLDYDMFITVGIRKVSDKEKLDPSRTTPALAKYIYLSWFDFNDNGSWLDIADVKPVKREQVGTNEGFLHNFTLIAQNTDSSGANDILNPAKVTMYVVRIDKNRYGYIAIRHSAYNDNISFDIARKIAQNTKFR